MYTALAVTHVILLEEERGIWRFTYSVFLAEVAKLSTIRFSRAQNFSTIANLFNVRVRNAYPSEAPAPERNCQLAFCASS